ncbi:glycosyltransferase family 4 protein [Mastigocoleus sp. MO_188.B34]|uniref:glycosyltransferase family 4 protein n=1 Tax=Mastigocoleus sp. MO_188.B34 TaxID=3036635 RepID=UPI0026256522|nr:glycosyltransferase family 4 protein [Mastigocoleus sp. MO_188.B34]MDJ0696055.1 glycosyltransferase family 4 protein [Mastigocoleus sp. MO_188.B34]
MNILILNQYALPSGSPGITRHGDLAKVLVKRGHQVTIVASGFDYLTRQQDRTAGKKILKENYSGVDFIWLKTTNYKGNDGKRVKSMLDYSIKALLQSLKLKNKPDIVIASSPHLLTGLTGFLLSAYKRIPLLLEIRDLWPSSLVDLGAIKANSLLHRILVKLEKFLYEKATGIITIPPLAYKRVQELLGESDKCTHIPNGIVINDDRKIFQDVKLPESFLKILEREKNRKIIIYAGAHGVANNLENVLETADYLREHNLNIYDQIAILFIGGGQKREELINLTQEKKHNHIHFHPPIDKLLLKRMLAHGDMLLLHLADAQVFTYGVSPNKLYDYFDAAKPVLFSSPIENNIVNQIQAGITFLPGRPKKLAEAIDFILKASDKERISMGDNARNYVRKYHNCEELAVKLEKLCLKCMNEDNFTYSGTLNANLADLLNK